MAEEDKTGLFDRLMERGRAHADALRDNAATALREKAAELREALGPEKPDAIRQPERPFGRDEGGADVKRVVWTGHTVHSPEGQAYFGAAGLTQGGYYRAAEVQVYGADEMWRWGDERHTDKKLAIVAAENMTANRLQALEAHPRAGAEPAGREIFGKEQTNMAEIPEHVKTEADRAAALLNRGDLKMTEAGPGVNDRADPYDAKAMEAQREEQRQNTLLAKPDRNPEPDKG